MLKISNLHVHFDLDGTIVKALCGVTLGVNLKETLVVAGESGSGKTVTALAVTRLLPAAARVTSGEIYFNGKNLLLLEEDALRKVRGKEIAYIFQEPGSFLNPVYMVGDQIMESFLLHQGLPRVEAFAETLRLLELVKIKDSRRVFFNYPHQLSGGMNQRVGIAMSLACRPKLLIADEPTTALDVTTETQILDLLCELKSSFGFSLLFITHNLSIARRIADRICVMYKGQVVEEADAERIFCSPQHFHTKELIHAYQTIGTQ
ncbi:MAG: ABC transporter ATP-binding protein [Candidatus Omnitrophota bacterium]|nr:MAG: ABC transporter ATP-binding protein [Candidatus Omnitrophota bacterium]